MVYNYNDDDLQPRSITDDISLVLKGGLCEVSHYRKEPSVDMCVFRTGLASGKPGCDPLRNNRQLQYVIDNDVQKLNI